MNTANNSLVEGCSVVDGEIIYFIDGKRVHSSVFLRDNKGIKEIKRKLQEEESIPTTFRGKQIELRRNIIITENAIDTTSPDEEEDNYIISYDGDKYSKEGFLKAQFRDYKRYAYKAQFKDDYIFYLSSNQRAKLQYHILSQYFDLVTVDEQDKKDFIRFCDKNETQLQKWHRKISWEDGIEKMITFGASLEVRSYKANNKTIYSNIKDAFCYRVQMDNDRAIYTGVKRTWEQWTSGMITCIEIVRNDKKSWGIIETPKETERRSMMSMYYQDGVYLTLPKEYSDKLKKYLRDYIKNGYAVLDGLSGEIPNSALSFTIDFNNDVDIVKQHDNTTHNQDMGYNRVLQTFNRLIGDEWTTQEIYSQGFNKGNIERFVKYGLIKRVKRGHYIRVYK